MVISRGSAEPRKGRIDRLKVLGTTEAEICRQIEDDGGLELGPADEATVTTPSGYVRAVREKFGLTQGEFAERFCLSERTIQEWEQGRAQPDGPARILLRVIEREPKAVERALRAS